MLLWYYRSFLTVCWFVIHAPKLIIIKLTTTSDLQFNQWPPVLEEEYVPVLKEVPFWYQWHLKGSTVPKKVPFKTALSVHLDKHIVKKKVQTHCWWRDILGCGHGGFAPHSFFLLFHDYFQRFLSMSENSTKTNNKPTQECLILCLTFLLNPLTPRWD